MQLKSNQLTIILSILLLYALFIRLTDQPFYLEEPRRALVSLEMQLQDDIIVPYEFNVPYYNKPPLWNWIILGTAKIFGEINEWSVRFPSVISFLLTGLLLFYFGKKYVNQQFGFLSAFFYLFAIDFMFYFSLLGEIDLFYTLVTLAMFIIPWHFYQQNKKLAASLSLYLLLSIGLFTKGLPSIVFAASMLFLLLLSHRKGILKLLSWQHFAGIALFAAILTSYYLAYISRNDISPYLEKLFFESTERASGTNFLKLFKHLITFPLDFLKNLLPALFLAPFLLYKNARKELISNKYLKYGLILLAVNIIVYWISTGTRQRYVFMLYPLAINAIIFAYLAFDSKNIKPVIHAIARVLMVIISITIIILGFLQFNASNYAILAINTIIVVTINFHLLRRKLHIHWYLLSIILILRLGFNEIVIPDRVRNSEAALQKKEAKTLIKTTRNDKLWIYGSKKFPRTTIYYYTKATGRPATYTEEFSSGDFFLVHENALPSYLNYVSIYSREYSNFNPYQLIYIPEGEPKD
jgi:4-amino-4-deoxy-L-arabinose transferase-like glycosyltransferase